MPENEVGLEVARLHVTDQDMPGSPAWQAVYRIKSGDQDGAFSIATDPNTNDGILRTAKVGLGVPGAAPCGPRPRWCRSQPSSSLPPPGPGL